MNDPFLIGKGKNSCKRRYKANMNSDSIIIVVVLLICITGAIAWGIGRCHFKLVKRRPLPKYNINSNRYKFPKFLGSGISSRKSKQNNSKCPNSFTKKNCKIQETNEDDKNCDRHEKVYDLEEIFLEDTNEIRIEISGGTCMDLQSDIYSDQFEYHKEGCTVSKNLANNILNSEENITYAKLDLKLETGFHMKTCWHSLYCCWSLKDTTAKIIEYYDKINLITHKMAKSYFTEQCVICQEEFTEQLQVCLLQCQHVYHVKCLTEWLTQQNKCPLCWTDVRGNSAFV